MLQRLLFIPVSTPKGIGEYMRSLTIAQQMAALHPQLDIRFVLNEHVEYQKHCPFKTYLCPSSPTNHNHLVNGYIKAFKPDVVLFDASGRVSQFKTARAVGARIVFLCQHNKKMRKGLSFRRLRYTDTIWLMQPSFCFDRLSPWADLKLSLLNKKPPRPIGPVFNQPSEDEITNTLAQLALKPKQFILVNAGSGGHRYNGTLAAKIFANVAQAISKNIQEKVVIVYGPNYPEPIPHDTHCTHIPWLDANSFNALLSQAKLALLAGGSALFQGISYGTNIVSCAVSKDQDERIRQCVAAGLIQNSTLDEHSLIEKIKECLQVQWSVDTSQVQSGLDAACHELNNILNGKHE